ncbi:MAG: hypothetical protein BJ554DRAFT_1698 [Olpidium bornovanus]|uniref:BHLH domain-containing protein n=1 Tax=Olpidium bornovanus TaxID=278681 RepID=A0A8H7ZRE0_9FUNG|nr:MAG: hypothetical protein BJ554DRAFT_1698 [Olpidium bornovanus]
MHHIFDVKKEPSPDYPFAGNQNYPNPSGLRTGVLNMSPSLGSAVGDDLVSAAHAASYGMSPADHDLFSPISLPSGEYLFDPASTPQDMAGTPPDTPGSPLAFASSGPIDVKIPRSAAATSGVNIMRNGYSAHFGPLRHSDGAAHVAAMGSPVPSVSTAHFHSMSLPVRSVDWFVAQGGPSSLGVEESFVGGSPQTRGSFTREFGGSPGRLESHESEPSGKTFALAAGLSHTELAASSVAQVYGGSFPARLAFCFMRVSAPPGSCVHCNTDADANLLTAVRANSSANVELIYEKRRRRRESHNAVERRRRDNINEKIHELSTLLPDCLISPANKPNKGIILRKSVDYIRQLQQLVQQQAYRNAELESMLQAQGADVGSLYSASAGCATPVMEGVHGEASVSASSAATPVFSSASPASQMPASGLTVALHHHHRQQMQLQLQHHRPFQARDAGVSFGYSDEFSGGLPLSPTTSDGSQ